MFVGFLLISVSAISLFTFSIITAFSNRHFFTTALIVLINVLLLLDITIQVKKEKFHFLKLHQKDFLIVAFCVLGAVSAYVLNVYVGLGAIVASSLIGLLGAILIPNYAVSIYCGSFVGMVSPMVLHDFYHVLLAASMAGIIFMLSEEVYKGYGGKLGATAFIPWVILTLSNHVQLTTPQSLSITIMFEIVVFSTVACFITYIITHRFKHDAVTSSSLVSLMAGLILPAIFNENGTSFAAVAMSASFAGMSTKAIIKNELQMFGVSVLLGMMFVYTYCHFGGAGGKLGTLAFASVITYKGFEVFKDFLYQKLIKKS
ncbi:MAG TPA: hypothetical protein PLI77_02555 [Bacteroidales bacterium]|nr:hypothetical protein [Bacteroidales bacterium]HPJ12735.1 hypothetical protein [Caldisericia bacterium]HRW33696.1 hypothetical protein [Thermotogota bacterium]